MEVQNASAAWLSDFEVFKVLQESKEKRLGGIKLPENILTVEFEVYHQFYTNYLLHTAYHFISLYIK